MDKNQTNEYSKNPKSLLIIDDEENMRHILTSFLKKTEYVIETACDGEEGLQKVKHRAQEGNPYDFILCDIKMPNMDGMNFLKASKDIIAESTVIMMSAYGTVDLAIEAMKLGAYDYISKPFKMDEIYLAFKKAEEREFLKKENLILKKRIEYIENNYTFGNMIAQSSVMQLVFKLAIKVAQFDTSVLITGESGTGKELVAHGIHHASKRASMAFVPVNCGSLPENLIESEFFGYKKGAFSGADRNKKGLFEEANLGTIFLDEIGELSLPLQVKLLRVLQENEIRPVGDSKTYKINVRVIAATARDLSEEVRQGAFRQDLFYRLNVLAIHLPPLRERAEDIPLLCQHFIERFRGKLNHCVEGITQSGMSVLLKHSWPGNVRELENVIERAIVLSDGTMLKEDHFPPNLGEYFVHDNIHEIFKSYSLKDAQKILEKEIITRALVETGGNRTKAVKLLEISHPSLLSKIKEYNIHL
ncbi:MAG: sigma-54-dependent Fis family transcriptional regulator [Desulfobacterales bacterium]|nr:sigma-54-dependent Fis family transcriptional regulator [Desulfobacterales bacterium]